MLEEVDSSQRSKRSMIKSEDVVSDTAPVEPYAKTIAHMRRLLERTSAPMQKLLDMAENRDILSRELETF